MHWEPADQEPEHLLSTRAPSEDHRPPLGGKDPKPDSAGIIPFKSMNTGILKVIALAFNNLQVINKTNKFIMSLRNLMILNILHSFNFWSKI